ncbi:MAG: nucleotidyltransferase domain-containing protein, partial [bacterium]|nr:nucleotidyltransferase domain-containing protein [Candidatus Kapabacteria bacterium]
MIDRETLIENLTRSLRASDSARAAWLGGSDATGRTDRWSDIDIAVVVEDDAVEETFVRVEHSLAELSPISIRMRIPQPTWHGFDQSFYQLRDAEPTLMIDLSVIKRSNPEKFLEPERHGNAITLFDRDDIVKPAPLDRRALAARMRARLEELRTRFPLFQNLVTKAVHRDSMVEAVATFHGVTFRPLVDILRIRYVPERFDFGSRYLQSDLSAELYLRLERMV